METRSLQTHHVCSTLKWRGNDCFHVVSRWNTYECACVQIRCGLMKLPEIRIWDPKPLKDFKTALGTLLTLFTDCSVCFLLFLVVYFNFFFQGFWVIFFQFFAPVLPTYEGIRKMYKVTVFLIVEYSTYTFLTSVYVCLSGHYILT